jgi:hypothetical protein
MNTLKIEATLANKYWYQPLPLELSKKYRKFFSENIPEYLNCNGEYRTLYTTKGTVICNSYDRIVVGDYGAFVEFKEDEANKQAFQIQLGQEYRLYDKCYNVKYIWYTIFDDSEVKIYYQKRKVPYADYKRKMFYVSVHEVLAEKMGTP